MTRPCAAASFNRAARAYQVHVAIVDLPDGSHGVATWAPRAPAWLRRPLGRAFARQARHDLRALARIARCDRPGPGVSFYQARRR
jgi:hypothetical protein